MTREDALKVANDWVAAWNAHDLEAIMAHYDENVALTSPVAAQLLGAPGGNVVGKANLKDYFRRGLEAFPDLNFQLEEVFTGVSSVVICYTNQRGKRTAEFMDFSPAGKVVRVVAQYNA